MKIHATILFIITICALQAFTQAHAQQAVSGTGGGTECKVSCLLTSCEIKCAEGSGAAVCTCAWGFASCACVTIKKGVLEAGKISATRAQEQALNDYVNVLKGLNSEQGNEVLSVVQNIQGAIRSGDNEGYRQLIDTYKTAVSRLSPQEKSALTPFTSN